MIKRLLLILPLTAVASILLLIGAAMLGGMCHCMDAMYKLFPYGTVLVMKYGSDWFGLFIVLLQFPLYALIITLVRGARWKVIALLVLVVVHVVSASITLKDYCRSRGTCSLTQFEKTKASIQ